jgi:HlyD family secretion protein
MNGFFAWLAGLLAIIPGLAAPGAAGWNGYVEVDYLYAAAPSAGTIASIPVAEGQLVKKGDVLFVLESSQQQAQLDAARARADAAEATLDNLKTGSRSEEIDVTRAALQKAEADLALAAQNLTRTQDLFDKGLAAQAKLDQAEATVKSAQAAADQLQAQLKVQELPARDAQQIAAEANAAAAKADADTAAAALANRTITAPEDGRIERIFFKTGEVAGAAVPVVSIAGSDTMKVLFYVNEADRQGLALGDRLAVTCDGCTAAKTATVSHFASDPQYTPPIIYSRDERARLVFTTEAVLADQNGIRPGQPVTVIRAP